MLTDTPFQETAVRSWYYPTNDLIAAMLTRRALTEEAYEHIGTRRVLNYGGELKIAPSMFIMIKETLLVLPDGPSKYLHDAEAVTKKSSETAPVQKSLKTTVK